MFPFGFLAFITAVVRLAEDRRERLGEAWPELFVVGDLQPVVEGLARQSPVPVVGVRVGVVSVGEQPQGVVEERPSSCVVFIVLGETLFDVGKSRADAVLVSLQRGQVDGVGEVSGQELVALVSSLARLAVRSASS